jgi:hypothetical protein
MKHVLVVVCVLMLGSGVLLAQETPPPAGTGSAQQPVPPAGQQPATPAPPATTQQAPSASPNASTHASGTQQTKIAPGSVIPVQLTKTVDAKKAKQGQEVVAKVTQDLQGSSGQVIVPKDTTVVGHVTEAQARSKDQKESQLAISFDRMDIKGGEQMQLPMSIQAIIAPPNRNANQASANNPSPGQTPSSSPDVGTGAPGSGAGGRGGMATNTPSAPQPTENPGNTPTKQTGAASMPQITGETRGVVGISNLTLSPAQDAAQGSVVTSEKNNVKLEDGTFLLLRVSPGAAQSPATSPTPQNPQR